MKGNGRIIAFAGIVVFIVVFILLNMTVFTISDISVQNAVYSDYIDKSAIIESSGIAKNQNIFLLNETNARLKIEEAFPYLEVVTVERKFPSAVIIHVDMRTPVMSIAVSATTDRYAIIDTDLKILDVVDASSDLYKMATHINHVEIASPVVGVTLDDNDTCNRCLLAIGKVSEGEQLQFWHFFSAITIENNCAYVTLRTGVTVRLDDIDRIDVKQHLRVALELYKTFDEQDYHRRKGFIFFDTERGGWVWSEYDNVATEAYRLQY